MLSYPIKWDPGTAAFDSKCPSEDDGWWGEVRWLALMRIPEASLLMGTQAMCLCTSWGWEPPHPLQHPQH